MEFSSETIRKILRNRKKLEKELKVKIEIKGNEVDISGDELESYIAVKVLDALDRNFPINAALLLINENYILEDIPIKSLRKKNIEDTKARIIGTKGKTLKILCELSSCHITLHDNTVSIIGEAENMKDAVTAVKKLIKGSKQANVYNYLEKHKKELPEDLGLKE